MSADVCYIVTNGFAARMVLQSEVIPNLRAANKEVVVIAPNAHEENMKFYEQKYGIKILQSPLKESWFLSEYFILKRYVYEDIRNNPALWEKHLREIRSNKSKHPWRRIRPFLYYVVYFFASRFSLVRRFFKWYEKRLFRDKKVHQLLQEINPKVVVATYPSNLQESVYLNEAKNLNIKTVIHLLSWDNISTKGYFSAIADYFISWGKIMSDEFVQYYKFKRENIYETGVAHFDKHRNEVSEENRRKYMSQLNIDINRPYLLFGMSSPYFCPYEIEIVEWIAAKVQKGEYGEGVQFVVRPHPQNIQGHMANLTWLPRLQKLQSEDVAVDIPLLEKSEMAWNMNQEDIIKLVNIMAGAAVVLNSGSTFSIDALVHEIPVIITSFDSDKELPWHLSIKKTLKYEHVDKLVQTKGVSPVGNYAELDEWIVKFLKNRDLHAAERKTARSSYSGENDGKASLRISEAIIDILKR